MNNLYKRKQHKGAVLLMALMLVAAISTLALQTSSLIDKKLNEEHANHERQKLNDITESLKTIASHFLAIDLKSNGFDHEKEQWAYGLPKVDASSFFSDSINSNEQPKTWIEGSVAEIGSKFNLGSLWWTPKKSPTYVHQEKIFINLCEKLKIPLSEAQQIIDIGRKHAFEHNTLFIDNVLALQEYSLSTETLNKLNNYVWVGPAGEERYNINLAPKPILAAIFHELEEHSIDKIIELRSKTPFTSSYDINNKLLGIIPKWTSSMNERTTVGSEYFQANFQIETPTGIKNQKFNIYRNYLQSIIWEIKQ